MKHLLVVLCMMCCVPAWAGIIKGRVADDKKAPLEFVNVAVYQDGNTAPVKGTVSDEAGQFEIDGVKDGNYVVKFTFMGYGEQQRTVVLNAGNQHTANLKTVVMAEDQAMLQEVSVSTQKAAMRLEIDKKVFDVSQSITTAGMSASEALENIPSVEVDQEGKISLRGSESVTVWINGKAQGLTSDNRGDILQQMPAESIERIEVITNPSSKYSPEGSAGIINIILKRDRKAGYYGGVQMSVGKEVDNDPFGRLGANINYSSGIIEAYANVGFNRRVNGGGSWTDRDYVDPVTGYHYGFMNSNSKNSGEGNNIFARAGLTWHFTKKDEISVGFMGMRALSDGKRNSLVTDEGGIYDEYLTWAQNNNKYFNPYVRTRESYNADKPEMNNFTLGYRHEWKSNQTLDVQGSYNKWHADNSTGYDQHTETTVGGAKTSMDLFQKQAAEMNNENLELQIDYTQPLGTGKMEAGYKGTKSHQNSPTETWKRADANAQWESDYGLFNRFVYDQFQHAGYLNYQNRVGKKFGYQLGFRAEYWRVETQSKNYDQEFGTNHLNNVDAVPAFKKTFFKVFPTVFLSYELPHHQELQLNYTRRLQRPWGGMMNSFKNISDSTNISFGNPELTPAYTNSMEINYLKSWDEHTVSVSAYYRPTTDVIQRVSYMENNIRYQTSENVSEELSSGVEIIGKNKFFKVIDLTTTVNMYYHKLDGGTFNIYEGGKNREVNIVGNDDFSWNASMMAQVMLPWEISFQGTGRYHAPQNITQGHRDAGYSLDLGLRRAFFNKKLTVNVNARDVLDSRSFHSTSWAPGFHQESKGWRGRRRFMVQLSYSFGNMRSGRPRRPQGQGQRMEGGDDEGGMGGGMDAGGFDM